MDASETEIVQSTLAELVLFLVFFMMIALLPAEHVSKPVDSPLLGTLWLDDVSNHHFEDSTLTVPESLETYIRGPLKDRLEEIRRQKIFEDPVLIIVGHSDGRTMRYLSKQVNPYATDEEIRRDLADRMRKVDEVFRCFVEKAVEPLDQQSACLDEQNKYTVSTPPDVGQMRAFAVMLLLQDVLGKDQYKYWPVSAGRQISPERLLYDKVDEFWPEDEVERNDKTRRRVDVFITEAPKLNLEKDAALTK